MRRLPTLVSLFTALFFLFSLTGNVLISDPIISSFALADDKPDGKIKLKKSIKKKKRKKNEDKDKDDDRKNKGVKKQIRKLNAGLSALQQQVDTIELTPGPVGPQGPAGSDGAQGPQGIPGNDGINGTNGIDGKDGINGTNGIDGTNGTNGAQGIQGAPGVNGIDGATGPQGPSGAEISGRLDSCIPTGGLGMMAYIPGRSFSVRLPFDGSFIFSHVPTGTHSIVFELNGNVIGTLAGVVTNEGQTTDVGVFVTSFCQGDADGDGFTGPAGDCDNNNASVNPSATEVCDSIDNNCDGQTDEGGVCLPQDQDLDGYDETTDCNDLNASVNPGATEVCDNIDNNCDGQTDEGGVCISACSAGLTECSMGQCIDLNFDTNNCGACGNSCASGQACVTGVCFTLPNLPGPPSLPF